MVARVHNKNSDGRVLDLMIHACVTLVYQSSVQRSGLLTSNTKKPVENYNVSKCHNSLGLYLGSSLYLLWDPENPRRIIEMGVYLDVAS